MIFTTEHGLFIVGRWRGEPNELAKALVAQGQRRFQDYLLPKPSS